MSERFPKDPYDVKPGEEPNMGMDQEDMDSRLPLERDLEVRDPSVDEEADKRALIQEERERIRHEIDPEYHSRQRARFLRSTQVEEKYSPANRNRIKTDVDPITDQATNHVTIDGKRMGARWNFDKVRDRFGPEGWEPVTDLELAKKIAPSSYLRQEVDGRIYTGDSYLCVQPYENVEQRNAQVFQKTERRRKAIEEGKVAPGTESFDQMHQRTRTENDPVGVRYSGKFSKDTV